MYIRDSHIAMQDLLITVFSQEDKRSSTYFALQFSASPINIIGELKSWPKDTGTTLLFRRLSKYVIFLLDTANLYKCKGQLNKKT